MPSNPAYCIQRSHERQSDNDMRGLPHVVSYYPLKISVGFAHFILILINFIEFFPFGGQKTTVRFVELTATQPQLWQL
jgi:hypothetical protein